MLTYTLVVDAKERARESERVWCEFVRLIPIELGRRYVLDNEVELHDAVESGQMTIESVLAASKLHFESLLR